MHPLLTYPLNPGEILKKRKRIKRELLASERPRIKKKIAVLGGAATQDIVSVLELFLLDYGIMPSFYESEYGLFYEEALFGEKLREFSPDAVFLHTSRRNITAFPECGQSEDEVDSLLAEQFRRFSETLDALIRSLRCPIIINNFEPPFYRVLGNRDAWDIHGGTNFTQRMNSLLYNYAREHPSVYINDIAFQSADYGLIRWSDPLYYNMYKYILCPDAIPAFAENLAGILRSIFGGSKKALVLDLDNTIWGGEVGECGASGIELGSDTPMGQVYVEFQKYLSALKSRGILLCVCSKNEPENALAGLRHPESILSPEDFVSLKASWERKDKVVAEIARELNILPDSIVFADDSPAEREIVRSGLPAVEVPELLRPENYITDIDRSGLFEPSVISEEDLRRSKMYRENLCRAEQKSRFESYNDYLLSLEMTAEIGEFRPDYYGRIAELCGKSNQFNLTTERFTESDIADFAVDHSYICLYGKLTDRFGSNGLVTALIGQKKGDRLEIILWLMSCRVLRRNMEHAMLDALISSAREAGISKLAGIYRKTQKNGLVKNFYRDFGFTLTKTDGENTEWELPLRDYTNKNTVISVRRG